MDGVRTAVGPDAMAEPGIYISTYEAMPSTFKQFDAVYCACNTEDAICKVIRELKVKRGGCLFLYRVAET